MYSRRTGVLQTSSDGIKKIESFNQNLRDQYNNRSTQPNVVKKTSNTPKINNNELINNILSFFGSEEVILITLILLLVFDINRDYLLIGALAILLLLG